jgi:hypothetical protein
VAMSATAISVWAPFRHMNAMCLSSGDHAPTRASVAQRLGSPMTEWMSLPSVLAIHNWPGLSSLTNTIDFPSCDQSASTTRPSSVRIVCASVPSWWTRQSPEPFPAGAHGLPNRAGSKVRQHWL